jgi:Flp pilus assembly protein TadG
MTKHQFTISNEKGFAFFYMAVFMVALLLFIGLAVDTGRAYVVKAQLSKAVDGAALGAARMLNSGNPKNEAARIFETNFPLGYMGTTSVTDADTDPLFYKMETIEASGVNVVTITATAVMPTSFMRLGSRDTVTVSSTGEAQRRMVDLSLVLDTSSSIGWRWNAVRDAARLFVQSFSGAHDRLSLTLFGNTGRVVQQMPMSRGFDKAAMVAAIPNGLPGGSTAMVEGFYHGWDELRTVPNGQQSGLRVIVLFTDGASNSVPGIYAGNGGARGLRTADFPKNLPDPDGQTHNNPSIAGFYNTYDGSPLPSPTWSFTPNDLPPTDLWKSTMRAPQAQLLPVMSFHQYRRSAGIPFQFPLQTGALMVNGVAQNSPTRRGLRGPVVGGQYQAQIWNINNASRNLLEIIANEARNDPGGDYRIRIYTIGMGELVRYNLGTMPEKPEDILKRIANDKTSMDYNAAQLEGKYYYAATADDVGPAFQRLQNQIIRLTK